MGGGASKQTVSTPPRDHPSSPFSPRVPSDQRQYVDPLSPSSSQSSTAKTPEQRNVQLGTDELPMPRLKRAATRPEDRGFPTGSPSGRLAERRDMGHLTVMVPEGVERSLV